jgi:hypothetical protein
VQVLKSTILVGFVFAWLDRLDTRWELIVIIVLLECSLLDEQTSHARLTVLSEDVQIVVSKVVLDYSNDAVLAFFLQGQASINHIHYDPLHVKLV